MTSSFLAKKVSQNQTIATKQNKRPFSAQKNYFPFWTILLKKKMPSRKKSISSGRWSKMQNSDQNRIYPSPILKYLGAQFYKIRNGKSVLDKFFFENDPHEEPKNMPWSKKVRSFREDSQKRKVVIKIEFTPLSDCRIVPFLKGF